MTDVFKGADDARDAKGGAREAWADSGDEGGTSRRSFLKCMAWAGTAVVWTMSGGVLTACRIESLAGLAGASGALSFVQLSDTHIGFKKEPNQNVAGTLQEVLDKINSLPQAPAFLLHTGDLTHLSKPEEFDMLAQILKGAKAGQAFYVPGEHDVFTDDGAEFLRRFGQGTQGRGWRSFDQGGVHFVGLNNVLGATPGATPGAVVMGGSEGMGNLGAEQLAWLEKDLAGLTSSTPVVVYAHVPLWSVYTQWGWATADSAQALSLLRRFGSVTVLNGHIHQIMQKVEGNITFHTARSTAYPQPAPGTAPAPGPLKDVPADKLRTFLGLTGVRLAEHGTRLAVTDSALG